MICGVPCFLISQSFASADVFEKWFHVCSFVPKGGKPIGPIGHKNTLLTVERLRGFEKLSVKTLTDMAPADLEQLGCYEVCLRKGA